MRLATLYKGTWIPEYSRSYLNQLRRSYEPDDLDNIAEGQLEMILRKHELSTRKNFNIGYRFTQYFGMGGFQIWKKFLRN